MTSKELPTKETTPTSITVDEAEGTVTIVMPLAPFDCNSESGKMAVLCTTNGWIKTQIKCPRSSEMMQANLFVGTRN